MNVASMLATSAERVPDKPALVFRDRPIGYAQLDRIVSQAAAALAGARVSTGDRVAIVAGNVPEFVYALYGAWRAGAVAVPLNVMLTAEELGLSLLTRHAEWALRAENDPRPAAAARRFADHGLLRLKSNGLHDSQVLASDSY